MDPNDWHEELISLFCDLSFEYHTHLWMHVLRLSPNAVPRFSDEEVLTVYLFGLMRQQTSLRAIHRSTRDHLRAWFPRLPSYGAFVQRLNHLAPLLPALVQRILERSGDAFALRTTRLVDSLPIVLAQGARAAQARVAAPWADKGYCASKRTYFYGVKLHLIGWHRPGTLPLPEYSLVAPASQNDLTVLKQIAPALFGSELFADRVYGDRRWQQDLAEHQQVHLHTPVKRKPGQEQLSAAERLYSRAVSRVRQSIESLFHWINQKTHLQNASRVRSAKGLWVHIFGRLAAAMLLLTAYS